MKNQLRSFESPVMVEDLDLVRVSMRKYDLPLGTDQWNGLLPYLNEPSVK